MANFNTHLCVALTISTSLATAGLMVGAYDFFDMVLLAFIGMVGGLLPDIDLPNSRTTRIGFAIASLVGASFVVFLCNIHHTIKPMEIPIYWSLAFLTIRWGLLGLFSRMTRHRGMVHSIPYMAVVSLLLVDLMFYGIQLSDVLSWLFGIFLFIGAMVHLLLDEIYSVNAFGFRIKKSFGTVLKLFETKKITAYLVLYGILVGLIVFSPPKQNLMQLLMPMINHIK